MSPSSSSSTPEKPAFPAINFSFAPAWWYHHYGMEFSESYWQDPIARTERNCDQRRLLFERFGDIGLGEHDPKPQPVAGEAYGHRFMSAFWGCEVEYIVDQFPSAIVLPDAFQRMENLAVPHPPDSAAVRQLYSEARLLRERYGHCQATINFGGPLNNAVSVFGAEVLALCKAQPELAQQVLQKMGEAVLAVYDQVVCPLNSIPTSKAYNEEFWIGNCPVFMVSPQTYREVVLPADLWLRGHFRGRFGLHHCGIFEPYAAVYRPLRPGIIDVGPGTDLRLTRAAYPDTPIMTYLEVEALIGISRDRLDEMIGKMLTDAAPPRLFHTIAVAEAGPEVSDETVRHLMTVNERIRL